MSATTNSLPTLRLYGTPFEIGKRFGELARERVQRHTFNQKSVMARLDETHSAWWETVMRLSMPKMGF
jgi:hypothetical protein